MENNVIPLLEDNPKDEALTLGAPGKSNIVNDVVAAHDAVSGSHEAIVTLLADPESSRHQMTEVSSVRRSLRVLSVEDSQRDAVLLKRHLLSAGYELIYSRVETSEKMRAALEKQDWDVILCDYSMPLFSALAALALLKELGLDIPFIVISSTIGELAAVELMRAGAHDYLMKENLTRLAPIIEREMQEAKNRRARRGAEDE